MIRIWGTIFAGLFGLAFGSFLNVCVSRWPTGESVVHPRSHCRNCGRTLNWCENIPVVSWLVLRGRCRTCGAWISMRYVVVEAAVGGVWAYLAWTLVPSNPGPIVLASFSPANLLERFGIAVLCWLLVALAALDAEHLWLPDRLTLSGIAVGLLFSVGHEFAVQPPEVHGVPWSVAQRIFAVVFLGGVVLSIRWIYLAIRRREGLGLGDVKLMAMIAAWLGLPGALLSFFLGVVLGAIVAAVALARGKASGMTQIPLGSFLCIGGIVSALWGQQILAAYWRWSGF